MTTFFLYYRNRFGFRKSFYFAFGRTFKDFLLDVVFWTAVFTTIGFVVYTNVEERDKKQATYVKSLEKIVADCLSDSTGKPVVIGNELYLCGIVKTGVTL